VKFIVACEREDTFRMLRTLAAGIRRRLFCLPTRKAALKMRAIIARILGIDMNKMVFATVLLAGFLTAPAFAQTKVGDWTVEKRAKDAHCNASRGYKDKEDENRDYVMVLSYSADKIVIVVIYDGWEWEKTGEILRADFSTDKADIMKKSKWEVMDKNSLRGIFEFDQSIMDALSEASVGRFRGR
jgi:hypothetical protein